jgi:UDP-N-acetylglucosamine acyltransferase
MAKIHPTAIILGEYELAEDVEIGPFCLLIGKGKLGAGTKLIGQVTLGSESGFVEIGKHNTLYPGASLGGPPQDVGYKFEPTRLEIGDHNTFREFVTVNIATTKDKGVTQLGSHNYLMAYTHIGHDCQLGNHIVIANNTHLGGHTIIEDFVVIGGVCAFNQFTRVGTGAFIAGNSIANKDILPFSKAQGQYAVSRATNKIGLQRRGFSPSTIESIHRAIRIILMGSGTVEEAIERIQNEVDACPEVDYLIEFIRSSKRGIAK